VIKLSNVIQSNNLLLFQNHQLSKGESKTDLIVRITC